MTLIADVFPKLKAPKKVFPEMPKKSSFRGNFGKQHNKWVEALLESERQHLYHIY